MAELRKDDMVVPGDAGYGESKFAEKKCETCETRKRYGCDDIGACGQPSPAVLGETTIGTEYAKCPDCYRMDSGYCKYMWWDCQGKHFRPKEKEQPKSSPVLGETVVKRYVLGFLFDGHGEVALIAKKRPEWQRGMISGIGGHIETDETPLEAMIREFKEETGCDENLKWWQFGVEGNENFELNLFRAESLTATIKSMTDETVFWYPAKTLPKNIIPSLSWMVPMAAYKEPMFANVRAISERAYMNSDNHQSKPSPVLGETALNYVQICATGIFVNTSRQDAKTIASIQDSHTRKKVAEALKSQAVITSIMDDEGQVALFDAEWYKNLLKDLEGK